jgi:predicted esterase
VEYLSAHISIPSFLVLTGHSDGAVFSQKVLTKPGQPFRGVISLSIQLAPGQFKEITAFTGRQFSQHVYHFVGSATRDATYR